MASSDPRIRQSGSSAVQVMKLATYANANYDIGGQEPYLCRTLDEKDLRNVSVTQVMYLFINEFFYICFGKCYVCTTNFVVCRKILYLHNKFIGYKIK